MRKIISSLKNTYSSGQDGISNYILKLTANSLLVPIVHITNLSLKFGVFPSALKISKICPIFKSGSEIEVGNYRPIALISTFSKIIEKTVLGRLNSFLDKNNIIVQSQYGFKAKSSTDLAILDLTQHVAYQIESKLLTLGVFVDLSKAFDSIDHNILFSKLFHYGIRDNALDWCKSFLKNRSQYVYVNNVNSN